MAISPPAPLSDTDKLDVLRRLDQFREWHSLDDIRYCIVCGRIITGRQIHVVGDPCGSGPLRLNCPTAQCDSIPMDWVLPTDENLALAEAAVFRQRNVASATIADHEAAADPTSQLNRFALHFKRAT